MGRSERETTSEQQFSKGGKWGTVVVHTLASLNLLFKVESSSLIYQSYTINLSTNLYRVKICVEVDEQYVGKKKRKRDDT